MICYNCKHNIADSLTECPVCKAPTIKHPSEPYNEPVLTTKIPKKNKIIMLIIGGIAIVGGIIVAVVK